MTAALVFPTPPWTVSAVAYGHDLSCRLRDVSLELPDGTFYTARIFDLAADLGEVDGRLGLAESLSRRLVTYAGTLIDDPDYGRDVTDYINDDLGPRDLALIASACEQEMLKDERVLNATAVATLVNGLLVVAITVFDGAGPFKLTLTVDNVEVAVLFSGLT